MEADKIIFRCYFRPDNEKSWHLLEQEAKLQVGLKSKPRWLPTFAWHSLLKFILAARFKATLNTKGGYIDDTSIYVDGIKKEAD